MKECKILIVEDEKDIVELLVYNLEKEGYILESALDGEEGYNKALSFRPDLIILDIMMPKIAGIELCQKLRANSEFEKTLIAFLTARGESFTQIMALDAGGDDFIAKPIKPAVLKSRIRALLRRHPNFTLTDEVNITSYGDLVIDDDAFAVRKGDLTITLAKKEFELLKLLVSRPGKVFKRHEILNKVWGRQVIVGDRTIDVHVRKLREKIGDDYIKTMKGVGYKFNL